jgi:hypothetical protein
LLVGGWQSAWSRAELTAFVSSSAFLPFWLFGPLWLFGTAFVTHWMEQSLHGPEPLTGWPRIGLIKAITSAWAVRPVRVALIAGSLSFIILLCIRRANWPTQPMDWDRSTLIPAAVLLAGFCAAMSVFVAWVLVQFNDERRRYLDDWARLPMEPAS